MEYTANILSSYQQISNFASEFYTIFSGIKLHSNADFTTLREKLVPQLDALCTKRVLSWDLLYLSLIPNEQREEIYAILFQEERLDLNRPHSLFIHCAVKKRHYISVVLDQLNEVPFGENVLRKLHTVNLFRKVHKFSDCCMLKSDELFNIEDHFVNVFLTEVNYLVQLKQKLSPQSNDDEYLSSYQRDLLQYFHDNHDLDEKSWEFIIDLLQQHEAYLENNYKVNVFAQHRPSEIFVAFTVVADILTCLRQCKKVSSEDLITYRTVHARTSLLSLKNTDLQLELLENIYVLLFLEEKSQLFCAEKEILLILHFLRNVLDELVAERGMSKSGQFRDRWHRLNTMVVDTNWRFDLMQDLINEGDRVLNHMFAPPECLICLCLKNNNFEKAKQVIEIFNLHKLDLADEICYTEKLSLLRNDISKSSKISTFGYETPKSKATRELIDAFFMKNQTENKEVLDDSFESRYSTYRSDADIFVDLCDILFTSTDQRDKCEILWDICHNHYHDDIPLIINTFYSNVKKLYSRVEIANCAILGSYKFDFNDVAAYLNHEVLKQKVALKYDEWNRQLLDDTPSSQAMLNHNHLLHKTFMSFQDILKAGANDVKYFGRLFNYLKEFAKIYYTERNNVNLLTTTNEVSYFAILQQNRAELVGNLLYDRKLQVLDLEPLFQTLHLDLLYHSTANCFPNIPINPALDRHLLSMRKPDRHLVNYIQKRNWLLLYLVNEIHGEKQEVHESRIRNFQQMCKLVENDVLKVLYDGNTVITALQFSHANSVRDFIGRDPYFCNCAKNRRSLQLNSDSFETAQEISEDNVSNWKTYGDLIDSIPELQLREFSELSYYKDESLVNLILFSSDAESYRLVTQIMDNERRVWVILSHFKTWPTDFCVHLLKAELTRKCVTDKNRRKLTEWLRKIEMYDHVNKLTGHQYWHEVESMCNDKPEAVLQIILRVGKLHLLLQFLTAYPNAHLHLHDITVDYIVEVLKSCDLSNSNELDQLFQLLPSSQMSAIVDDVIPLLRNIGQLEYLIDYITDTNVGDSMQYFTVRLSIAILKSISRTQDVVDNMWCLLDQPLDVIETLLMNTKLDLLGSALHAVENFFSKTVHTLSEQDYREHWNDNVDELLRLYAEKSLEMRVVTELHPKFQHSSENKLMQSLDSLYGSDSVGFNMPSVVPTKSQWLPNNEVIECMCCQQTTFSMFNRRHHCRRCGRVVCFNCSSKRMHVQSYGDVLVRVCLDCYQQSHVDGDSLRSGVSFKSVMYDNWQLTKDFAHNTIIRGEFAYEHAPSVTLCLAILKHHSRSLECSKFLLAQCKIMMRLLRPISAEVAQEIDHPLVIKMIKSLAIATKISAGELGDQVTITTADRVLSEAELLGLLIERGCLNLLPAKSNSRSDDYYVDATTLRKLRDTLIEREQWQFALEVSTKAGLDNTGVFAAWGKSYLKAGSLQMAREKFHRCLDKRATHYEGAAEASEDSVLNVFSGNRSRQVSRLSTTSSIVPVDASRPNKNSALLTEIVQILESNASTAIDPTIIADISLKRQLSISVSHNNMSINSPNQNDPDVALAIASKLRRLTALREGVYTTDNSSGPAPRLHNVFFDECIYYLTRYGTMFSLLEFYVRHDHIADALRQIIDYQLSSETFVDFYMLCLQVGQIGKLLECLSTFDSTLDIWKNHLRNICRHLEKNNLLNSLYQLQQFMGDFIRASMTCIRFYKHSAMSYNELVAREHHLHNAKKHLMQDLEQDQWVEVATVRKLSEDSRESFEEKGLANPSLVMKVDSRNINKYIQTIETQIDTSKLLAQFEQNGKLITSILAQINAVTSDDSSTSASISLPTLFGSQLERIQLCVLIILSAPNIEEGYVTTNCLMQDYKLKPSKVYCLTGKILAQLERNSDICELVEIVNSTHRTASDGAVTDMCDEMLSSAVRTLLQKNAQHGQIESLIGLITDRATKISSYIECKQLKSAYLMAVRYNRIGDIRRILREAELLNKPDIKKLCQKILQAHARTPNTKE